MIALARRRDDKTEVKQPVSAQDMEEVKEESLTRLRQTHGSGAKVVQGGDFANFPDVHPKTFERLAARGITSLFPIQQHCFYPIYEREDLIGRDLTGSGKTLGFALPIVEYLRKNKFLGQRKIQAVVLAPTRELALQVRIWIRLISKR